jgi:hypothetical protein
VDELLDDRAVGQAAYGICLPGHRDDEVPIGTPALLRQRDPSG